MILSEFSVYDDGESILTESLKLSMEENLQFTSLIESVTVNNLINMCNLGKILLFIINKFIEIIKKLWDKFKNLYYKFTNKSSLISKYKSKLLEIKEPITYDKEIQVYENLFDSSIFNTGRLNINKLLVELSEFIYSINNISASSNLYNFVSDYNNKIDNPEYYFENLRREILNARDVISKEEFGQALLDFFKPNDIIHSSAISPQEIKSMVNEFLSIKKTEKNIVNEKNTMINIGDNCKRKVNIITKAKIEDKYSVTPEISNIIGNIFRNLSEKIQGTCNVYITLFSVKLDMFREYKAQEINILSNIILNQIKEGKM